MPRQAPLVVRLEIFPTPPMRSARSRQARSLGGLKSSQLHLCASPDFARPNGTVESTTLNFHDYFYVYGGMANTTTVNGGFMYIYDGATANATTISGGSKNVSGPAVWVD